MISGRYYSGSIESVEIAQSLGTCVFGHCDDNCMACIGETSADGSDWSGCL